MIVQAVILAALLLTVLLSGANTVSVSTMISMIIAVLIVWVVRGKRRVDVSENDEWTKKLGTYAATYSWLLTLVFIALLFWIDYFTVVELTVTQALGTTLFVMVLSMNVFRWYFSRKGDVE